MIEVTGLHKSFATKQGDVLAVAGVSFTVETGRFSTLVGPSGCGKTTTLRLVAGLEAPTAGEIKIGDSIVYSSAAGISVPANRRSIGMVFQSYAIWPHMTVFENVAYPLQVAGRGRSEVRARVLDALRMVDLAGFEERPAPRLSGGQQQRVALARAMVLEPDVLLLDEPLSNLDASLRMQMRDELKQLQQRIGITTLYVTHDQDEALSLSDDVAVMSGGKIIQSGPPQHVYTRPTSSFTATFIGSANLISGRRIASRGHGSEEAIAVRTSIGTVVVRSAENPAADEVQVCIRPEAIELVVDQDVIENVFQGTVVQALYLGHHLEYLLSVESEMLRVSARPNVRLAEGTAVRLRLPPEACVLIESASEGGPHVAGDGNDLSKVGSEKA